MGVTIQFESHRNELAAIYELEHDQSVLEFYDQPQSIKLNWVTAAGRGIGVFHTPDFFVIRTDSAGYEECKPEQELTRLAERSPQRYQRDETGHWRSPPGESSAGRIGFYYRLRSSDGINWIWQRNIQFLENYLRNDRPAMSAAKAIAHQIIPLPVLTMLCLHISIKLGRLYIKQNVGCWKTHCAIRLSVLYSVCPNA
ncbi:MAG: Tn7 transposase TnsA N-terminal domain-containing protein [Blastocatellales bacterium]